MKQFSRLGWGILILIGLGNWSFVAAAQLNSEGISGNIFGRKHGMVHPFLIVTETYTDNLTNSAQDEESDLISVVSPGIALALPGSGRTDLAINTSTASPGGLVQSRMKMDTARRFQGILRYNPSFKTYKDHSDENFTAQDLTGAFQYKAPGGLTIDLADKFQRSQEMWGETGSDPNPATYKDNLTHAIIDFSFSSGFSITVSGGYHTVTYKDKESSFRDRDDTVYAGALNYHVSPKLKLFCEYKHIDVTYDAKISESKESTEDFAYAGISWDLTAKSKGLCKIGYVSKDFTDSAIEEASTWTGEVNVQHMFTNRTMIMLDALHEFFETNLPDANYYTTSRLNLTYNQAFTPKLSVNFLLSYQNDDYDGIKIENDTYMIQPGLDFSPYRWLTCRVAYSYSKRTSDDPTWEYVTNQYTFLLKASF